MVSNKLPNESMGPPAIPGEQDGAKDKAPRQSFSCAECRRLKLKCSRTWPCTSCEKRGCAQICPNGEMRTGKGKRLILANTEELHHRISLLEVALAASHGEAHDEPHPLLSSASVYLFTPRDGSSTTRPYPRRLNPKVKEEIEEEEEVVESAFGTLTIGVEGEAKFVGSFAGSEYLRTGEGPDGLLDDAPKLESPSRLPTPPVSATGRWTHKATPKAAYADGILAIHDSFIPGGSGIFDIRTLRERLPDWEEEGRSLVESYWENVNWMYQILPRPMFDTDHLMNAYDSETPANAHKLACVFLVMAIGVMFDLNRPPFHKRGEELFLLGRACLSATGLEHASPATVQALHLMGTFMMNDNVGNGAEIFWPILGTAVKVAQSLGLHRDGSAFGLSMYEVEERRQVYWEVVTYDRLQALCFGRPCATSNKASDTKFPEADEQLIADGDGYHHAKYRLIHMMERVIDMQTQTTPLTYASVTQLDSEIREFKKTLPETLLPNVPINELPLDRLIHPHLVIHRLGIRLLVAQTRLLLNRPAFARALKDNPDDPSRSKFSASFVALYESAQEIVQLVKQLVIYHPSLVARWWFFWFHAFSSAVCLSAIAIRAPTCAFATPSFHGMSLVCDVSAAAREGCRAKNGLPILMRLRKRAQETLTVALRGSKAKAKAAAGDETTDDDLSHLHSTAKLRRVGSSPPAVRSSLPITSPPRASREVRESTNSPHSATSAATSTTLADNASIEGAVPQFPGGFRPSPLNSGSPSLPTPAPTALPWFGSDSLAQYLNVGTSPTAAYVPTPLDTAGSNSGGQQFQSWASLPNQFASNGVPRQMGMDIMGMGMTLNGMGGDQNGIGLSGGASHLDVGGMDMGMGLGGMNMMDMDMSMALGGDMSLVLGGYDGNYEGMENDLGVLPASRGEFDMEAFLNQMGGD